MTFNYKKNMSLSRQIERLRRANDIGSKILFGALGLEVIYSTIEKRILAGTLTLLDWFSVGLTGITIFVAFFWLWSPLRNIRLAEDWLADSAPSSNPQTEWISAIGVAILFAVMLLSAFRPLLYAITFVLYSILYLLGVRHYHGKLQSALANSIACLDDENVQTDDEIQLRNTYTKAIQVLKQYHFDCPHQARIVSFTIVGLVSIVLCVVHGQFLNYGQHIAIWLIGLNLLIAEFAIIKWRADRDTQISILEKRRCQYEHQIAQAKEPSSVD